jgi:general secretion pathway protein A
MLGPFSSFFDLRDNPFRANPDPRYLFLTQQTKENLNQIIEAIRARKGLLLLTGEVGTGKTVLLNRLMEWLEQERIPKAFIFNSHIRASELLDLILADFAVPFNPQRGTPLAHLHSWLQDRHCAGQSPVLFVDEAQGLSRRTLDELRMLLNLQTPEGSLLQIVLCGQPEFEETLDRPELRQLRQRIALRCRTTPLTLEETQGYIDARLRVAGGSSAVVFHPEAVQALSHYSRGLPRVLNALCEQSLMRAAGEKIRPVPGRMVGEAARELQYDEIRPFVPLPASDDAAFSGLSGHLPAFAESPEIFAAPSPFGPDAPLDAKAPAIATCEPKPLAAAAAVGQSARTPFAQLTARPSAPEPGSGAPRISRAPIAFPSPGQRQPPSPPALASDEIIARLASASNRSAPSEPRIVERATTPSVSAPLPVVAKEVPKDVLKEVAKQAAKKENDFRKRWRRHHLAAMNSVKSALSAIALASRVRLVHLRTRTLLLFRRRSEQWSTWRNLQSNLIKTNFKWNDLASSCLRWLRAPSRATWHRHALPNPQVHALRTESSARITATQPLRTRSLPRAGGSKVIGSIKKTPRFSTSILHWLQEPSHSLRERKAPRSSNTHLA